ncbi:hypothetical protein [Frondihabitans australicus]|uniref:Uncharacterized protein n=1 Tax=Frondihabitans australicus TaxID=386892 RepID=A0A495IEJ2_9MICO|nr:hypothetical protein [Frondihabitans australicus]RKR73918.1 hypothetical protein C8E83_1016 [Frondihabitans australicus]
MTGAGAEASIPASPFTMLGSPDALACEGDACVIPSATVDLDSDAVDIEPSPQEAAAASGRAVAAALDEGASL